MKTNLAAALIFLFAVSFASAEEKRFTVPVDGSPVCGPPTAAVTIIEFIDFQ